MRGLFPFRRPPALDQILLVGLHSVSRAGVGCGSDPIVGAYEARARTTECDARCRPGSLDAGRRLSAPELRFSSWRVRSDVVARSAWCGDEVEQ